MTYPPQGPHPSQGRPWPGHQPGPPQGLPRPGYPPGPPRGFPQPGQHGHPPPSPPRGFPQPYRPPDDGPTQQFPSPGPPPPKPQGLTPRGKVVIGVVVAAVIGLVVIAVANWGTSARAANVGDCLKVVSTSDAEAGRVECSSPEAVYRVAKKLDSGTGPCPQGDYTEWVGGKRTDRVKLCLVLNAREGDCFKTTSSGGNDTDERVACGASADLKVVRVVTGKADKAACAPGNLVATYSEPATTLCLTEP